MPRAKHFKKTTTKILLIMKENKRGMILRDKKKIKRSQEVGGLIKMKKRWNEKNRKNYPKRGSNGSRKGVETILWETHSTVYSKTRLDTLEEFLKKFIKTASFVLELLRNIFHT